MTNRQGHGGVFYEINALQMHLGQHAQGQLELAPALAVVSVSIRQNGLHKDLHQTTKRFTCLPTRPVAVSH
jgi:hypothetical protein